MSVTLQTFPQKCPRIALALKCSKMTQKSQNFLKYSDFHAIFRPFRCKTGHISSFSAVFGGLGVIPAYARTAPPPRRCPTPPLVDIKTAPPPVGKFLKGPLMGVAKPAFIVPQSCLSYIPNRHRSATSIRMGQRWLNSRVPMPVAMSK